MGIRNIHLVFITASVLLATLFGGWSIARHWNEGGFGWLVTGIGSGATAVGLVVYGRWFLSKSWRTAS